MRRSVFLEELLGSTHVEMLFAKAHGPTPIPFAALSGCPSTLHLRPIPCVDEAVDCEVVVVVVLGSLAAAAGVEGAVVGRGRSRDPLQLVWGRHLLRRAAGRGESATAQLSSREVPVMQVTAETPRQPAAPAAQGAHAAEEGAETAGSG